MPAAKRLFSKTLTLSDITCRRGGRVLFQNVSLTVPPGGIVHLTGRNGAGKSSLLRLIAGALPTAAGRVLWDGADISEMDREDYAQDYAFLPPDDRDLKLLETARENLLFWAMLWKIKTPDAAVNAALADMGLAPLADVPVRVFSAGQKRRLSLARLRMKQSALWLLDEPFNALDSHAADLLADALRAHAAAGDIVVLAAHQAPALAGVTALPLGAAA